MINIFNIILSQGKFSRISADVLVDNTIFGRFKGKRLLSISLLSPEIEEICRKLTSHSK
jgi:hypothetical protein